LKYQVFLNEELEEKVRQRWRSFVSKVLHVLRGYLLHCHHLFSFSPPAQLLLQSLPSLPPPLLLLPLLLLPLSLSPFFFFFIFFLTVARR
jgi:hypothetical protein